jgi:hypothetical protein
MHGLIVTRANFEGLLMKYHELFQPCKPAPADKWGAFYDVLAVCAISGTLTILALSYFDILTIGG